jgi:hypothetical protein
MKITVHYEEIDLSKAELFADSSRGVYIPQFFAQTIKRELVTGINKDEYERRND